MNDKSEKTLYVARITVKSRKIWCYDKRLRKMGDVFIDRRCWDGKYGRNAEVERTGEVPRMTEGEMASMMAEMRKEHDRLKRKIEEMSAGSIIDREDDDLVEDEDEKLKIEDHFPTLEDVTGVQPEILPISS